MKNIKKVMASGLIVGVLTVGLTGCMKPYDKPELVVITPSQTAFLIPLVGQTSDQKQFMSEDFLQKAKVATKEIQIPHRWVQTGRWESDGEYRKSADLIVVERKPETREWTNGSATGTSSANQGIKAETKESIAFSATMNCSAQIDETDAVRFLYRYNNQTLSTIMDSEIRNRIAGKFVEQCSKYTLSDLLLNKETIMKAIRDDVVPYFKDRGITINTIALNGDLVYDNAEIQKSIDEKFKSAQQKITQENLNAVAVSKAEADRKIIETQAATIEKSLELKRLENQAKAIEKWDGHTPQFINGGENGGTIFNIPMK